MTEFKKTVNVDNKFEIPMTLNYDETSWEVAYHFVPTNMDVEAGGSIKDGQLVLEKDSCGFCGNMMSAFQQLYEDALAAK